MEGQNTKEKVENAKGNVVLTGRKRKQMKQKIPNDGGEGDNELGKKKCELKY